MKKPFLFICFLAIITACRKYDNPKHYNPVIEYRNAPAIRIDTNLVDGVLLANRYAMSSEVWAWFYNNDHTHYIPMEVTINGYGVGQAYPDSREYNHVIYPTYLYHSQTTKETGHGPSTLGLDSAAYWQVRDSISQPLFDFQHGNLFPKCTGVVPTNGSWSSGLSLVIDSTTVTDADSIYITVSSSFTGGGISKAFSATQGIVTFDLSTFIQRPSEMKVTLMAFTQTIQTLNGHPYAFIKQDYSYYTIAMSQ